MTPVALTPSQRRVREIDAELKVLDKEVERVLQKIENLQVERVVIILRAEERERLGMKLEKRPPVRIPSDDFLRGVVGVPRGDKQGKPRKQKELPADLREW